ncbi:MAG: ribosome biogenesis GTP-binding protein YihA/YsxC [Clostridia bacterium]
MRFINTKFIKSASKKEEFIIDDLPQIAIVGRSNVGKSSLINMLTNNSKMAKTSSTPGRTRLVNYFNVNEQFYLVDLPGYGYHKASKSIADSWDKVMNDYFVDNDKLRVVMLLLDSRILPTELDIRMLDFLATHDIPCVIVLTKTDKLNRSEINNAINKVSTMVRYNKELIIPTSASKKQGVEKIGDLLENYLED